MLAWAAAPYPRRRDVDTLICRHPTPVRRRHGLSYWSGEDRYEQNPEQLGPSFRPAATVTEFALVHCIVVGQGIELVIRNARAELLVEVVGTVAAVLRTGPADMVGRLDVQGEVSVVSAARPAQLTMPRELT